MLFPLLFLYLIGKTRHCYSLEYVLASTQTLVNLLAEYSSSYSDNTALPIQG